MSARAALTPAQRKHFAWLEKPYLRRVVEALEAIEPGAVRFVGGCVRDSLLSASPKDFDLATLLTPDKVMDALGAAGLGAAPTGVDHGTVTAIVDHKGVEITTLRADVSTDGRRATVAFTRDWEKDASRRDFTINAIYLSPDGLLFDPVGGLKDVRKPTVRFIGAPDDRIKEDYLRILRFFRFTARFAKSFDAEGLEACIKLKAGIDRLSAERVGAELMAILALPRAYVALREMTRAGILETIWMQSPDCEAVRRLKEAAPEAGPALTLAALYDTPESGLGARLRLSNGEKAIRRNALRACEAINDAMGERELRRAIYLFGKDVFSDGVNLGFAKEKLSAARRGEYMEAVERFDVPAFAFKGRDLLAAGVPQGPAIARILSAVEKQWIEEDFPPRARLEEILGAAIDNQDAL